MAVQTIVKSAHERCEQWRQEQHERALAVIAEFGGRKPERMLVPEDDPPTTSSRYGSPARCCFCATRSGASARPWRSCRQASRSC
jgi:hypothetical protein